MNRQYSTGGYFNIDDGGELAWNCKRWLHLGLFIFAIESRFDNAVFENRECNTEKLHLKVSCMIDSA